VVTCLFTIIVPTVNRPETLVHTLRTLVDMGGDDYEIVVTDDAGHPENRSVVESFGRPDLIRYIRHETRQGMRGNYEFSVGVAQGQYVTILGDDDGLVANALGYAREAIAATRAEVLFWWPHMYWWPTALIEHKRWMLYIQRPTKNVRPVEAFSYVAELYKPGVNHWLFERLPSIYNGFVSRPLLQRLKERTGAYFLDEVPDVYSGIANGVFAQTAAFIEWPLSIRGISGKSFGVAFRNPQGKAISDEFKGGMKSPMCEPDLVDSTALAVHVASIKLRAIRRLQGPLSSYTINVQDVINGILGEIQEGQGRKAELLEDARALGQKYGIDISGLRAEDIPEQTPTKAWGWHQDLLAVNCEFVEVADIHASRAMLASIVGL
jgi:hypothetical protein